MSKKIYNGGLELGVFQIVGDENLTDADKKRKKYLESLPKNKWIDLDENGKAITPQEAEEAERKHLSKYGIND